MALDERLLDNWFTYHPPKGDQSFRYAGIRAGGRHLADVISDLTPPGCPEREQALAKVREAVMWANAAIACNEARP